MESIKGRRPSGRILLIGAISGALIGLITLLPILVPNNGQYMDYGDYFLQYVPFIKELKRMFLSGSMEWSWNSFLGDSFISAYSYYTVFNPFAWLVALFPNRFILYGTLLATLLKLSLSMITSILYIGLFCKDDKFAWIGGLLYTFSGFTFVNSNFYFFLDIIAVFPLVLFGLELLIDEGKKLPFILSLTLNAAINYYFFVSTVILVIIYVIFRLKLYNIKSWAENGKSFISIVVCSLIGTGLAAVALVPSFYAILGSGKATENIGNNIELMYWPQNILERLRTFIAPIESGRYHAFYDSSGWSSSALYLPVFGCTLALQRAIQKKDWLAKICLLLTICYFVPVLNAAFNLFSSSTYTRWLYGFVLLIALMTALSLEEVCNGKIVISKKLLIGISGTAMILILLPVAIYVLYLCGISVVNRFASACLTEYFMGYKAMAIMVILTIANYIGLWYLVIGKKKNANHIALVVLVVCLLNGTVYNSLNYDLHGTEYSNSYYYQKAIAKGDEADEISFEYRIDYPSQILNYGLFKNKASVNYYNSLQNHCGSCFAELVGIGDSIADTTLSTSKEDAKYTDALLSVKYYYDYDGNSDIPEGFSFVENSNGVDIYQNDNYIPIGFTYTAYCLIDEIENLSTTERAQAMLDTLVIEKSDEAEISQYLPHVDAAETDSDFTSDIQARREFTCSQFTGTSNGFNASIDLEEDNIVFFSIPCDEGWNITVNGSQAKVYTVDGGLIGILCSAGHNEIVAVYNTKGIISGVVISCSCLTILIAWMIANKKKRIKLF